MSEYDQLIDGNRRMAASLERQLRELEAAYRSLLRAKAEELRADQPYINMKPIEAARIELAAHGRMARPELEARIIAGGITVGKKRAEHNVRISIDTNLKLGNLVEVEGMIDLPPPESDSRHDGSQP